MSSKHAVGRITPVQGCVIFRLIQESSGSRQKEGQELTQKRWKLCDADANLDWVCHLSVTLMLNHSLVWGFGVCFVLDEISYFIDTGNFW